MTDLEYRCVHGHDKCSEMYPGPECPYCERIYAAPFVKLGEIFEALCADAEDRPKFYASMGLNFEKIIGDALAAARREGAEEALRDAAQWHKAEAAKALSEAERLSDWGRWWRGDETWRDRAELHERAAAHLLGEKAW